MDFTWVFSIPYPMPVYPGARNVPQALLERYSSRPIGRDIDRTVPIVQLRRSGRGLPLGVRSLPPARLDNAVAVPA